MENTDKGHKGLLDDITELYNEVEAYEFHDFKNEKYPAPKISLAQKLHQIRENVINGKYDN